MSTLVVASTEYPLRSPTATCANSFSSGPHAALGKASRGKTAVAAAGAGGIPVYTPRRQAPQVSSSFPKAPSTPVAKSRKRAREEDGSPNLSVNSSPSPFVNTSGVLGPDGKTIRPLTSTGRPSHARKTPYGHVKRPRNAFIIFRSYVCAKGLLSNKVVKDHCQVSRIVSKMWNELPPEEKAIFQEQAREEKEIHRAFHPDYRYQPVTNRSKTSASARDSSAGARSESVGSSTTEQTSIPRAAACRIRASRSPSSSNAEKASPAALSASASLEVNEHGMFASAEAAAAYVAENKRLEDIRCSVVASIVLAARSEGRTLDDSELEKRVDEEMKVAVRRDAVKRRRLAKEEKQRLTREKGEMAQAECYGQGYGGYGSGKLLTRELRRRSEAGRASSAPPRDSPVFTLADRIAHDWPHEYGAGEPRPKSMENDCLTGEYTHSYLSGHAMEPFLSLPFDDPRPSVFGLSETAGAAAAYSPFTGRELDAANFNGNVMLISPTFPPSQENVDLLNPHAQNLTADAPRRTSLGVGWLVPGRSLPPQVGQAFETARRMSTIFEAPERSGHQHMGCDKESNDMRMDNALGPALPEEAGPFGLAGRRASLRVQGVGELPYMPFPQDFLDDLSLRTGFPFGTLHGTDEPNQPVRSSRPPSPMGAGGVTFQNPSPFSTLFLNSCPTPPFSLSALPPDDVGSRMYSPTALDGQEEEMLKMFTTTCDPGRSPLGGEPTCSTPEPESTSPPGSGGLLAFSAPSSSAPLQKYADPPVMEQISGALGTEEGYRFPPRLATSVAPHSISAAASTHSPMHAPGNSPAYAGRGVCSVPGRDGSGVSGQLEAPQFQERAEYDSSAKFVYLNPEQAGDKGLIESILGSGMGVTFLAEAAPNGMLMLNFDH